MTDPMILSDRMAEAGAFIGEGAHRDRLAERFSREGMTEADFAKITAWVDAKGLNAPGLFLAKILRDPIPESWRRLVKDIDAHVRNRAKPGEMREGTQETGHCVHGHGPLDLCDSCCMGTAGVSEARAGCWNPITQSHNPGKASVDDSTPDRGMITALRKAKDRLGCTSGLMTVRDALGEKSEEVQRRLAWVRTKLGRTRKDDAKLLAGWEPPTNPETGELDVGIL